MVIRLQDEILCVHGGMGAAVQTLSQIKEIQKPVKIPDLRIATASHQMLVDLLWSAPVEDERLFGIHPNLKRGATEIVKFGCVFSFLFFLYSRSCRISLCSIRPDRVSEFCKANGVIVGRSGGGARHSNTIALSPPLIVEPAHIGAMVETLAAALERAA